MSAAADRGVGRSAPALGAAPRGFACPSEQPSCRRAGPRACSEDVHRAAHGGKGIRQSSGGRCARMFQKFKISRALLRTLRLPAILRNARARGDERCQAPNRTGNGPTSKKLRRQASPDGEGEERDRQDSRRDTYGKRANVHRLTHWSGWTCSRPKISLGSARHEPLDLEGLFGLRQALRRAQRCDRRASSERTRPDGAHVLVLAAQSLLHCRLV
jgi:hypothetical protein